MCGNKRSFEHIQFPKTAQHRSFNGIFHSVQYVPCEHIDLINPESISTKANCGSSDDFFFLDIFINITSTLVGELQQTETISGLSSRSQENYNPICMSNYFACVLVMKPTWFAMGHFIFIHIKLRFQRISLNGHRMCKFYFHSELLMEFIH